MDNPTEAAQQIDQFFEKVKILSSYPKTGRYVPELNRIEIRELIYGNYRINYRIEKSKIYVLTFIHSKQTLPVYEIWRKICHFY